MHRTIGRLLAVGLLSLGALSGSSAASTGGGSSPYTVRVLAGTSARTIKLRGDGTNLHVVGVRADGRELVFGDGAGSDTATMYGDGVIVRFIQRHAGFSVAVVAISGHPVISVTYSVAS